MRIKPDASHCLPSLVSALKASERLITGSVELSARRPFLVLLGWILIGVFGALSALHLSSAITNTFNPPANTESTHVDGVMTARFAQLSEPHLLLVIAGEKGKLATSPDFKAYEAAIRAKLRQDPTVDQVLGAQDLHIKLGLAPEANFLLMTFKGEVTQDVIVPQIRSEIAEVPAPTGIRPELTDMMAISHDIFRHTSEQLARVERVGLLLSAIVLIYVFGGLFAASLPLLTGILCITINNGLLTYIARAFETSTTNQFITAIVGLAIGIDYPLFLLTRVREEMRAGVEPIDAFKRAAVTSGKAITFSGWIVAVSSLCLGILDVSGLRAASLSVTGVVVTALALCFSFIPALVFAVGRFYSIDKLLGRTFEVPRGAYLWERLITFVVDRPKAHLAASLALITLLAVPISTAKFWSPTVSMLPRQMESMQGLAILTRAKESGQLAPIYVTVTASQPGGAYDPRFVTGLYGLVRDLEADTRISHVTSMVSFQPGWSLKQYIAFFDNPFIRSNPQLSYLVDNTHAGQTALLRVVPRAAPDSEQTRGLIQDLRARVVPAHEAALGAASVSVGGEQAKMLDVASTFARRLPLIAGLNLFAIILILGIYFRSIFLPIKAIVMNLLPLLGAFGVVVLVFQHGLGARLIGVTAPGYVMLMTPAILLTVLFALSMDYEVIILSRIKESYDRTGDNRTAILEGLNKSGKVIVGAAAIMFSVFFAYVFADLAPMKEVGLGLASAIIIDATVVRLVVLPATMILMGRWNYWLPKFERSPARASKKQAGIPVPP